jgi:succinyl-CoA synthetase beta subunit
MIPIPLGTVAFTAKEAFTVGRKFGSDYQGKFVVKAQVKRPGRGKAVFVENDYKSGIHIVDTIHEVQECADAMLGKHMHVPSQSKEPLMCTSVLVMEHLQVEKQFFI